MQGTGAHRARTRETRATLGNRSQGLHAVGRSATQGKGSQLTLRRLQPLAVSALSALVGTPYMLRYFGPTEAEVAQWGVLSISLGGVLMVAGWLYAVLGSRWLGRVLLVGCAAVAVLQPLPVLLWIAFHGSGISDGSPPSTFVAHSAYALPHLLLLAASVSSLPALLRPAVAEHEKSRYR